MLSLDVFGWASRSDTYGYAPGTDRGTRDREWIVGNVVGLYCRGAACTRVAYDYNSGALLVHVPMASMPGGVDAGAGFLAGVEVDGVALALVPHPYQPVLGVVRQWQTNASRFTDTTARLVRFY